MADYLKIKCYSCGHSWNVYAHEADQSEMPPRCPFCQERMGTEAWKRLVNGLFTLADANKFLLKDAEKNGSPFFQAETRNKN